jgi:hypothetical protein
LSTFLNGEWRINFGSVLDRFEINMGSTYYPEFPMVPVCRITCCEWTSSLTPSKSVGQRFLLEWFNGTAWQPFFEGKVVSIEVVPQGNDTYLYNIVAEAPWRFLASETIGGGGYPAQTDQERISAMITEAANVSWSDMPSAYTWANIPDDWGYRTWSGFGTYTSTFFGSTSLSSTYDVIAYTDGEQQAMGLLDQASADVRGRWFSDCTQGLLLWRPYGSVASELDSPSMTFTAADMLQLNTSLLFGVDEINNVISIDNGIDPITSVAALDSIRKYGQRDLPLQSWLVAGDQQAVAENILSVAAEPHTSISQVELLIAEPEWDAARLYSTWQLICNFGGAELQGVPEIYGGDQTVFVTGADVIYESSSMFITLKVLAKDRIVGADMWQQVDSTTTWATYPGTTIWADA